MGAGEQLEQRPIGDVRAPLVITDDELCRVAADASSLPLDFALSEIERGLVGETSASDLRDDVALLALRVR